METRRAREPEAGRVGGSFGASEAEMKETVVFSYQANPSTRRAAGRMLAGMGIALLLGGMARAQADQPQAPAPAVQGGYEVHQTAELGGRIATISGSGAMYDTLVNLHSGPRVLGQTFTMRALPGRKRAPFDSLTAFSSGFGGDPYNFAKLDFSKGNKYEFTGTFRRDRQYFDYDLLGNVNVPGLTVPYGLANNVPTASVLKWTQLTDSPLMYNTVRRMTDVNLTVLPLSRVTFRVGYSQNIFQGPSVSPGRSIGKNDNLLDEYQRNSTDDFIGAIDWKPWQHTKLTYEELVDHYKGDSYFTLDPKTFIAQEADGTPVSLGNWDSLGSPYPISSCNTGSMGSGYTNATNYTIFSAPQTPGGLPVINPACDVVTSYLRSQPTRTIFPTEVLRVQSDSLRNIALNGDFRYSLSNSSMPSYYENWTGLDGTIRSATFTGATYAQRRVVAFDYGMTWDATKTITLSDDVDFSNVHQPGWANISTGVTANTTTNPNETINFSGALVGGAAYSVTGNPSGARLYAYFGNRLMTNNATVTWDATTRATLSLTYRYQTHDVIQTSGTGPLENLIAINENGGIFNAALRPTAHLEVNGSAEIAYFDNSFTPLGPRQLHQYRVHTMYRPKPWATLSGSYNDLERHNNTNNTGTVAADGPLDHVDHTRVMGLMASLAPNEHYGLDLSYSYSDVYISTNACYLSGASATLPGAASTTSTGAPNLCPNLLTDWGPVKDFMDAPTQYASLAVSLTPAKQFHSDIGYRISAVSGNQFFNDAQEVNGSLQSAYQSPYVNLAWTVHPGWIWRFEYNYYGYGEGGPSGATMCSTTTSATAAVVPCTNFPGLTAVTINPAGFTAPRNFHANNITLGMHYEF